MSFADQLLPEFDDEMARTRKVLAMVPADKMEWQAHEGLHTIGWNANHLADSVGWAKTICQEDFFDIAPPDCEPHQTPSLADPAEILSSFDAAVVESREAIAGLSDAAAGQPWSLKQGGNDLFTLPRAACLRTWTLNHTIHHRGILSVYLRMLGVELTPVYDG